jgi:hypothetical protein
VSLDLIWAGKGGGGEGRRILKIRMKVYFIAKILYLNILVLQHKNLCSSHPIGLLFSNTQNLYVDFRSLKMLVSKLSGYWLLCFDVSQLWN